MTKALICPAPTSLWNLAMVTELDGLAARKTWDAVHISTVPAGTKIMRTKRAGSERVGLGPRVTGRVCLFSQILSSGF